MMSEQGFNGQNYYWLRSMNEIENKFEECRTKARQLAVDHGLAMSEVDAFEKTVREKIYVSAARRNEFEWQAAFVKRHGF